MGQNIAEEATAAARKNNNRVTAVAVGVDLDEMKLL